MCRFAAMECTGTVVGKEEGFLHVRVRQTSACAVCGMRKACPTSEYKEKVMKISVRESMESFSLNQQVTVCVSKSMGMTAAAMVFGVPLLVALVWLPVAVRMMKMGDVAAVVTLLMIFAVYFLCLKWNHNKLDRVFQLRIKEDPHPTNGLLE